MSTLLPEEIILEILSRSVAESLSQCKLLSKKWLNIICKDKSFAQMHSRRIHGNDSAAAISSGKAGFILLFKPANNPKHLQHVEYDDDNYKKPLKFETIHIMPPCHSLYIVGSANGLICISLGTNRYIGDPIYICNPLTKEYVYLPKLSMYIGAEDYVVSGFGYHPCTSEYKVIRIFYDDNRYYNEPFVGQVQVYTLGSGNGWRNTEAITYELFPSVSCDILADGALHWFEKEGNVVAFDLADEKFHILPKPKVTSEMWNYKHSEKITSNLYFDFELRVLGGCLCIIDRVSGGTRYPIWSFRNRDNLSNKSIKKRKRVHDQENNAKQTTNNDDYKLSWSWEDDSVFDWEALDNYKQTRRTYPFAILKDGTQILYHDCRKYLRQDLGGHNYQHIADGYIPHEPIRYMKSFVSLKALGEKEARIFEHGEEAQELQGSDFGYDSTYYNE